MEKQIIPASEYWPGFGDHRHDVDGCETLGAIGSYGRPYRHVAPLRISDAGRAESKRGKQRSDCTVVSLAHATGVDYDVCYDALAAAGRKSGRGFNADKWLGNVEFHGWRFRKLSFPAVKGMRRVSPVTFALRHREGRFILHCAGHVMACVDGIILDSFRPRGDACVYGAWEAYREKGGNNGKR